MKLNIIKIGNSLGIRLPKSVIAQCKFEDTVLVKIKNGALILLPDDTENPRAGWDDAFKKMATAGDDKLIDAEVFELESDREDWKW